MTFYEIPTSANPQRLSIQLAGVTYGLRLIFCEADAGRSDAVTGVDFRDGTFVDTDNIGGWILDISDSTGNTLAAGIPLVTGVDLLGQLQYIGIGGSLFATTDGDPDLVPSFTSLGTGSHLYFAVP